MTAEPATAAIQEGPAIVDDFDELEYHRHPALSSTDARRLLPPSCPAAFRWAKDHPPQTKPAFDFGHAAHQLVLGAGAPIERGEFDDRRTKAFKEWDAETRAAGAIPLLSKDYDVVLAMADAIHHHPVAGPLFDPNRGVAERSWFVHDPAYGVDRRARTDWLLTSEHIAVDYKSAASASPYAFAKSVADHGYHQQQDWYQDLIEALTGERPGFVFVAQEKEPPYLVAIYELDDDAVQIGRAKNRDALELYADCAAHDTWPGYGDEVLPLSLPRWADFNYRTV